MTISPSERPTRDWCVLHNAQELAARITDYWATRGREVSVVAIGMAEAGDPQYRSAQVVRSNMVGGLPPRHPSAPVIMQPTGGVKPKREIFHPMVRS